MLLATLLFLGMGTLSLLQSRQMLIRQLNRQSQDVAYTLSVSLSQAVDNANKSRIKAVIRGITHDNIYQQINVYNAKNQLIYGHSLSAQTNDVPLWFQQIVPMKTTKQHVPVMSGWKRVGQVTVQANPAYAHQKLWLIAKQLFLGYIIIAALGVLLGMLLLRFLLIAINAIRRQTEAISQKNFIQCDYLPRVPEFRIVVETMNKMATNLNNIMKRQSQLIQQLYQQAYQDPVTHLGNRSYLEHIFGSISKASQREGDINHGWFYIIELDDLNQYAKNHSYQETDELLSNIASILAMIAGQFQIPHYGRLHGGSFAILALNQTQEQTESMAQAIIKEFKNRIAQQSLYVGVSYFKPKHDFSQALALADQALAKAKYANGKRYIVQTQEEQTEHLDDAKSHWKQLINQIIDDQSVYFVQQPVWDVNLKRLYHYELFMRAIDHERNITYNASELIPIAETMHLMYRLDQLLIEKALQYLGQSQKPLAINISSSALNNAHFLKWFTTRLESLNIEHSQKLTFEVAEPNLTYHIAQLEQLTKTLRQKNIKLGIDHVGMSLSSLYYLSTLPLQYLKLDSSLIQEERQQDNLFLINSLCNIAHVLDIQIIPNYVETEQQINWLKSLEVDALQGFGIAGVETFNTNSPDS